MESELQALLFSAFPLAELGQDDLQSPFKQRLLNCCVAQLT